MEAFEENYLFSLKEKNIVLFSKKSDFLIKIVLEI